MSTISGSLCSDNHKPPEFKVPVQTPPESSGDEKAESEASALAFGLDLESAETRKKIAKISSEEAIESLSGKLIRHFMVLASIVISLSFIVLFYHFIAPESWLFLNGERVQELKEFLLSGGVGAALAALGKSHIMKDK